MTISQRDIKLLWGRAANRCSICKCELSQDKQFATTSITIGEQAHIIAEAPNGPRGKSMLPKEERNSYFNLILLCPNHHTIIDNNVEDFPVEKLHMIKAQHELWVQQTLTSAQYQSDIDLEPVSWLLAAIRELQPLLFWLYSPIPASKAKGFLNSLQSFWHCRNLVTENIDSSLTKAMDCLLRPLASGHFTSNNDLDYTKSHILIAYEASASYFSDRGFEWQDDLEGFEIETILGTFEIELHSLYRKGSVLNPYENMYVRLALCVTKYFLLCMKEKKLLDIPEVFLREFHVLSELFFNTLGFRLPDSVDNQECEILYSICEEAYENWDHP